MAKFTAIPAKHDPLPGAFSPPDFGLLLGKGLIQVD
jgi:hypothetical protein